MTFEAVMLIRGFFLIPRASAMALTHPAQVLKLDADHVQRLAASLAMRCTNVRSSVRCWRRHKVPVLSQTDPLAATGRTSAALDS